MWCWVKVALFLSISNRHTVFCKLCRLAFIELRSSYLILWTWSPDASLNPINSLKETSSPTDKVLTLLTTVPTDRSCEIMPSSQYNSFASAPKTPAHSKLRWRWQETLTTHYTSKTKPSYIGQQIAFYLASSNRNQWSYLSCPHCQQLPISPYQLCLRLSSCFLLGRKRDFTFTFTKSSSHINSEIVLLERWHLLGLQLIWRNLITPQFRSYSLQIHKHINSATR